MNQNMPTSAKGAAMANPYGAAITGGISMVGDMIATSKQNHAARRAAKHQRDFQLGMSSTAHQREVADLKAAGLNPILSGTGGMGASTGSSGNAVVSKHNPAGAVNAGLAAYSARANATLARNAEKRSNDTQKIWDSQLGQEILVPFTTAKEAGAGGTDAKAFTALNSAKSRQSMLRKAWNRYKPTTHVKGSTTRAIMDRNRNQIKNNSGKLPLYPGNQIK